MESPVPVRRTSSSSQTYQKLNRSDRLDRKKKVQVTSFNVPFGKISLTKKVDDKIWQRQNKNIRERYYPAVLSRNQGYYQNCNKGKWKSWADEVFSKLPVIGSNNLRNDNSMNISLRVKKQISSGDEYVLFQETSEKHVKKPESYSMHKTFYDVVEDLNRRKKEKKQILGYYY